MLLWRLLLWMCPIRSPIVGRISFLTPWSQPWLLTKLQHQISGVRPLWFSTIVSGQFRTTCRIHVNPCERASRSVNKTTQNVECIWLATALITLWTFLAAVGHFFKGAAVCLQEPSAAGRMRSTQLAWAQPLERQIHSKHQIHLSPHPVF